MNIVKKNKNSTIIHVKDGFVTYKINIKEFSCQCTNNKNNLCNHILFILYELFGLSTFVVSYIDMLTEIRGIFTNYLNLKIYDDLDRQMEEEILGKLDDLECGICLMSLSEPKFNFNLYKCSVCKNCVHMKCMTSWQNAKKNTNTNKCIYCMMQS